jgi:regulator of protease activity HflC (stomatin/prohibitin superfamily)
MPDREILNAGIAVVIFLFAIITLLRAVKVVPQSQVYVVERFGKYIRTLAPGMSVVVPYIDAVRHRISILERQLEEFTISIITKDNVEIRMETTVFFRVIDASRSVYRIQDVTSAIHTAASSIVRSAAGKLELDELQSSRESMNSEIARYLQEAAEVWGIEITRTEITDVIVDDQTKAAQRQQLNAERERRAVITRAEGDKRAIELTADARLYEAQKLADAVRIEADAAAYEVRVRAAAEAEQTRLVAEAIANGGQPAVNYDIMKRQISALGNLAGSNNTKTLVLPTDVTAALGSLETLLASLPGSPAARAPNNPPA